MACTQPNLAKGAVPNVIPVNISGASASEAHRRLFVSDNPEYITTAISFSPGGFATLWHDEATATGKIAYRIFLWHVNELSQAIKVGITIGNGSSTDTYQVQNLRLQAGRSPGEFASFAALGICCAKALVGNTLDAAAPVDASISPNTVGLVREFVFNPNVLLGAVVEFDLVNITSTTNPFVYRVRTVASNTATANLRLHSGTTANPVDPVGDHPRGSWSFAAIQGNSINYVLGSAASNTSISNKTPVPLNPGTDNLFTAAASYNPTRSKENRGHFGARYFVTVNLQNTGSVARTGTIHLNGRGGIYGGAVKVAGVTNGVPVLQPHTEVEAEVVQVASRTVPANSTVSVALEIVHAGATNLPLAILCRTV